MSNARGLGFPRLQSLWNPTLGFQEGLGWCLRYRSSLGQGNEDDGFRE